jgi:tetratricopeptide (TPR) repeat protein
MLKDSQGTLEDLHKVDVLEPNNAITLQWHGDLKRMLEDYQRALEDLHKADVLEPNNAFNCACWGMSKGCWRIIEEL